MTRRHGMCWPAAGWVMALAVVTGAACGGVEPPREDDPPTLSVTGWTERTELFAEYPPLVQGETVRFAVHLTELADFSPMTSARPRIELRAADGRLTTLAGGEPSRPGIFRVEGVVPAAGEYQWSLVVGAPGYTDRHELGAMTVYPDAGAALAAAEAAGAARVPAVSYLKEQQWTNDFGTISVAVADLRVAVRAPATIAPISGGEAVISTPVPGRLSADVRLPVIGQRVAAGAALARIEPRLAQLEDRAALVAAVTAARADVDAAEAERQRAEGLLAERAVPARRVEDAHRRLTVAKALLEAAEARLAQRDETLGSGGGAAAGDAFELRAPIDGTVVAVYGTPGAAYDEGTPLIRIVRTDRVLVVMQVPQAEAGRVGDPSRVALELHGSQALVEKPLRRLYRAGIVDPATHAVILTAEVDNADGRLLVGQVATALLYSRESVRLPAVPVSAVLTDAGRPLVFVQVEGERFVRRSVQLGPRDGSLVAIAAGLAPGERVVTRGAYEVLLASAARSLPAEGHVH